MLQCHVIVTSDTNARCYASQRGKLQAIALPLLCHKLRRTICPRQFSQSRSKITFQIWGENYVPSFWIFTKKDCPQCQIIEILKKSWALVDNGFKIGWSQAAPNWQISHLRDANRKWHQARIPLELELENQTSISSFQFLQQQNSLNCNHFKLSQIFILQFTI